MPPCSCSPAQYLHHSNSTLYNLHLPNQPSSLSQADISPSFIFTTLALESLKRLSLFEQAFYSHFTEPLPSQPQRFLMCSSHPTRCFESTHIFQKFPIIYRKKCEPLSLVFEDFQGLAVWVFSPLTPDYIDLLFSETF